MSRTIMRKVHSNLARVQTFKKRSNFKSRLLATEFLG
jgi:hypothetical protein